MFYNFLIIMAPLKNGIFHIEFKGTNKPSSDIYFENLFNYHDIHWTAIYMLLRLVTRNTHMRSFHPIS